ncbi:MAG: phage holin family protein [Clostridia bacterium]|nr:phage holin family protein [Clostridia bacterium]
MKSMWVRAALSAAGTAIALAVRPLWVPILLLFVMVTLDYVTGMISAALTRTLSSQRGWTGILKKLCYFIVICVGAGIDRLLALIADTVGIDAGLPLTVSLFVVSWLIINEAISILENLAVIGVPVPPFLRKLIDRLKVSVEQEAAKQEAAKPTTDADDGASGDADDAETDA